MFTPAQMSGARGHLRLGLKEAARIIGIAPNTLSKAEHDTASVSKANLALIVAQYQARGVEFGDDGWTRAIERSE